MSKSHVIHVAHAIARRNGTHYRARAYALSPFGKCAFTIALCDTPQEAESEAVRYIRETYIREGLDVPESVVSHGRKAGAIVDSHLF